MQRKNLLKNFLNLILIGMFVLTPLHAFSADLDSTNFKIVGATTNGGGIVESQSGDYSALLSVGAISADPRNYSNSYKMYNDPEHAFIASVPTLSCFETTTDGYSNCITGPTELSTGGMVAICGSGGCYNKGRFEISENGNPSDTLYSVEISRDNFASDIEYIDGSTYRPESSATHNIDDFKTKADWETETFNVQGLDAGTTYYLRVVALNGAFTQSDPGPNVNATTAEGLLYFDIDIADSNGSSTESSEPYSISFSGNDALIGGSAAITATNRIWIDTDTNSEGGFAILVRGKNGGLQSSTTGQTITSATANLDSVSSGFGIQSDSINYTHSLLLGSISATSDYSGSINNVGIVSTDAQKVYEADGPIESGRLSLKIIAKPGTDKTAATDYSEEISILFVPRY